MKRIVFRLSILGIIVALGLLAIAHAQRTVPDAPPDDGSSNPLRNGQPQPAANDRPADYRADAAGPVDTDVSPHENPLRRRRPGATAACERRPAKSRKIGTPTRIRLVADGAPAGGNAGNPGSTLRVPAVEPQLMPATADRYAVPARPAENQNPMRQPLQSPLGRPAGPQCPARSGPPPGPARCQEHVSSRLDP